VGHGAVAARASEGAGVIKRPVLRYHGGKFRIAEWVISHFPPHLCYVEPYAGAASVLMRKPRAAAEVLNERDDRIVNVFRILRDPVKAADLKRRLELTPFSRVEFNAAYAPPVDEVDAAMKTITLSFMGQGSDAVTRGYRTGFRCALRNRDNAAIPSHEWADWPTQIPAFVKRLQGVAIENTDALAVIRRLDRSPSTLFYVDPPYPFITRSAARSRHGYKHEMTDDEHRVLAETLRGLEGMVVLSGYACDLYDLELYADWDRHEIESRADRGLARTEVLWLNAACAAGKRQGRLIA
jgi:DNA adenine methylase